MQSHLSRPQPPRGIYLQIYRGAVKGATAAIRRDVLKRYCADTAAMGLPGICFHGFPRELLANWPGLAKLAGDHGMLALASWGLDGKRDNDGSPLTATEKGDCVGQVLAHPSCAAGLLDAEGQWDSDLGPADDMDEAGAIALGKALRARAPAAIVGDQPWYAIDSHGSVRRPARPIEHGGVFAGFPVDEFAVVVNWGRFRQAYIYLAQGAKYVPTFARMDREWGVIAPALERAGLDRPLYVTLQGYRWLLHQQVHALLDRGICRDAPVVVWCDPWPDATCLRAIRAVMLLEREGFARPGMDAREVVRAFQRTCPGLEVDGWWGEDTARAAGLW